MKTLILVAMLYSQVAIAQLDLPELSPQGDVTQRVGYTNIHVRYGRPAARERKVMGDLVPFGRLWRTGAGATTTISFSHEVGIAGKSIPAGTYALVTVPGQHQWTIMLNRDTTRIYGDPSEYDVRNEALRIAVPTFKTDRFYESLTVDIDIVRYDALLSISWERTRVALSIETFSHQQALTQINKVVKSNGTNPEILAQAAYYYDMNNEDLDKALEWLDTAIANNGDRWVYSQKVHILAKQKRYAEARAAALHGIEFLRTTKPREWEFEIQSYQNEMNKWPPN